MNSPTRLLSPTRPIVIRRKRPFVTTRDCILGVGVVLMAMLTLASVTLIAAQTPTFRKVNPPPASQDAPTLLSPATGRDEVTNLRFDVLRDSHAELKAEMVKQREESKAQTIKQELQGAAIARIESYLIFLAGILSAVVVGMLLQIYQSRVNGRLLRQAGGIDNTLQG